MYRNLANNRCIPFDEDDADRRERTLICPVCGFNCCHIIGIQKDDPRGWGNYGNVSVEIWGECGHTWTIFFNDHKGAVIASTEYERTITDGPRAFESKDNTELKRMRIEREHLDWKLKAAISSLAASALCADCEHRMDCAHCSPDEKCPIGAWSWSEMRRDPTELGKPGDGADEGDPDEPAD